MKQTIVYLIVGERLKHMTEVSVFRLLESNVGKGDAIHCNAAAYDATVRVTEELLAIVSHIGHTIRTCECVCVVCRCVCSKQSSYFK